MDMLDIMGNCTVIFMIEGIAVVLVSVGVNTGTDKEHDGLMSPVTTADSNLSILSKSCE